MAIAHTPTNFYVTQANRQVLLQWDYSAGATDYVIQRSDDGGLTYSTLATVSPNTYLDTSVVAGSKYYYKIASSNLSGVSTYTVPQYAIPTPTGEMSLAQIRLSAQQRADRVNSNFVTLPEWNSYINQAMFELYDLLVTSYEDYFIATPAMFTSTGGQYIYPLPDGNTTFTDTNGNSYTAPPFYKMHGLDLGISSANNAWVTVQKFMFQDRNKYVYPNSNSTIYGVFNMQYRVMGNTLELIPTPAANQVMRIWYIPRLPELLMDTDTTDIGISGWIEYVIVRAAIYALAKEESDVTNLEKQLIYLKQRIEETAQNRDVGQPDRITDIRSGYWGSNGSNNGGSGPIGGF